MNKLHKKYPFTILIPLLLAIILGVIVISFLNNYSIAITKKGDENSTSRTDHLERHEAQPESMIGYKTLESEFMKINDISSFISYQNKYSPNQKFIIALIKKNRYDFAVKYELYKLQSENTQSEKINLFLKQSEAFKKAYENSKGLGVSIEKGKEIFGGLTDIGIIFSNLPENDAKEYCQKISEKSRAQCLDNYYLSKATSKDGCKTITDETNKKFCESIF